MAISSNPLFALDTREIERIGPSYTYDTLASLREEAGAGTPIYLLLGADAFLNLPSWYRWRELFDLAHIVVVHRPGVTLASGAPAMAPELNQEWQRRYNPDPQHIATAAHGNIVSQEITALDISASAIRRLIAHGKSARYLLPDNVLDYIFNHHLYAKESHES